MRSVLSDVSISELMTMREEQGMSNREIADSIGCSYYTVLRLIGKQPAAYRKTPEASSVVPAPRRVFRAEEEEVVPASLVLAGRTLTLQGEVGKYEIDSSSQTVHIQIPEQGRFSVSLDSLKILHSEIAAIIRNEEKTRFGVEAW